MNEEIKNLGDIFIEFGCRIKQYEANVSMEKIKEEKERLYSTKEIEKIYPILSKYHLTKAVNEGKLPVTCIGNTKYFYLKDIDNFIAQSTKQKLSPDCYTSWRAK